MIQHSEAIRRLQTLTELLSCSGAYYLSTISLEDGKRVYSEDLLPLKPFFLEDGCEAFLWDTLRKGKTPLILWSPLGLMWLCVCSAYEDAKDEIVILGPVRSRETSNESIESFLKTQDLNSSRISIRQFLSKLPRASYDTVYRHTMFLAYCVRGEKIPLSEIVFQRSDVFSNDAGKPTENISKHFGVHQFLDLIYDQVFTGVVPDMKRAVLSLDGYSLSSGNLQNHQINAIAVVSIAVKASMDAGLLPARAFLVAERQLAPLMQNSATPADAVSVTEAALRELAEMVYELKYRTDIADPILQCMAFIDANPEAELRLDTLAFQVNYSKYYLTRKFKERTGQTVMEYVHRAKVKRARILLRTTNESLREIAKELSLSSASHLGQLFKKYTGQTAAQYRKTCRERP